MNCHIYSFTYDENGNLIEAVYDFDPEWEGHDLLYRYTYEEGVLSSLEADWDGDGTFDSRTVFVFDDHGNKIETQTDTDHNGAMDYRVLFTYECWE